MNKLEILRLLYRSIEDRIMIKYELMSFRNALKSIKDDVFLHTNIDFFGRIKRDNDELEMVRLEIEKIEKLEKVEA